MNKCYILAPYVTLGFIDKALSVGFGSIQHKIKDRDLIHIIIDACCYLKKPISLDELQTALSHQYPNQISTIGKALDILSQNHMLLDYGSYDPDNRYSRQHLYFNLNGLDFNDAQKELAHKHITLIGCGGIGNIVSISLATAGVGQLTLIDDDHIELSNLTRQFMFKEEDVGLDKTQVLCDELVARNSDIKIHCINEKFDTLEKFKQLPDCDLVVISGDSFGICDVTNAWSFAQRIPFINVGYIQDIAVWGPFIIPGVTGCYQCFAQHNLSHQSENDIVIDKLKEINRGYQAPSIGAVNMLAAAHATLDILRYLTGNFDAISTLGNRKGVWTHNLLTQTQTYKPRPDCSICT